MLDLAFRSIFFYAVAVGIIGKGGVAGLQHPVGGVVLIIDGFRAVGIGQAVADRIVGVGLGFLSFGAERVKIKSVCGRARLRILAGAKPAPEGLAICRVASPWTNRGNPCG
jgi:hypothetical protein